MTPRVVLRLVVAGVALAAVMTAVLSGAQEPERPAGSGPAGTAVPSAAPLPVVSGPTREAAPSSPNIVMVMADDMRADDLLFMPSLRKLVGAHGLTFQNSFSPYPLCCPARASFLTGQYAHNHHVWWHEEPYGYGAFDDSRTLATSLSEAGYATGFIGKYLNRYGPARSLVSGGPSYRHVPNGWTDWRGSIDHVEGVGIHGGTYHYLDTPFNVNGKVDNRYRGRYNTHVIGDFSVDMARRFGRDSKPFFMYVNYVAPHFGGPFESDDPPAQMTDASGNTHDLRTPAVPRSVRGRFDRLITRGAGMPRNGGPSEANISDKPEAYRRNAEPSAAERRAMTELTRQRAESIYVMDRQVRRLVRELKRSGEWRNTVFMFTSDNGYYLGEHRKRSGKARAHEPSLRVPFLVTGPGMRTKAKRYDPITTIDVSASILDLASAEPPRLPDGISRVPTMREGDQGWTTPVLNEATFTGGSYRKTPGFRGPRTSIGIRTARYSYIRSRTRETELYDLARDPLQMRNVHGQRAYREAERALSRVWWQTRHCDGQECLAPLPPELRAGAGRERVLGRSYWRRVLAAYGFRAP
ncbi:sulfatase [Nocardioides sp. cx-173]|uniref:sulfatase family protein n=1 Tax=Nocardioides sp. cx-173 TaxID=2898796 RepID=UPI001E484473|nr:sulfatase [Nocardioides sp. cx-173]MCD4526110.1 sulfatase [Nocardioides sp. cx-173]UGB43800.1 sulfatase [Nocardioides sp. cx-173]